LRSSELREGFLRFFEARGHKRMASAPLIPSDPTTLFTVAGMQQFVPAFRGEVPPPAPRAATSQKCLRIDDLDQVGRTARHETFFEMLGNFSFGDYFKEDAIAWAWELVTGVWKLPKDIIWITVHPTDTEAPEIWVRKIGVPRERIVPLEDNWWPTGGGAGPCGPDSEMVVDLGPEHACDRPDCGPACACDRWAELWNLVFQQYNKAEDGTLTDLPTRNIDTGMGLERLAMLMQGKRTIFETDLFWPIISYLVQLGQHTRPTLQYGRSESDDVPARIIADHSRAISFLIADGVTPSNEGRGYVLRRLIRRAARFGRTLGIQGAFVHKVVPVVARAMGDAYPELAAKQENIVKFVQREEERFAETLEQGTVMLERVIERLRDRGETVIAGADAFELYDTYGFPVELTAEMAAEQGFTVDEAGYREAMEEQRVRARAATRDTFAYREAGAYAAFVGKTEFRGYEETALQAAVIGIVKEGEPVERAGAGEHVDVILDRTPFYAAQGGQIGDTGTLAAEGLRAHVLDVTYPAEGALAHHARIIEGTLEVGRRVEAAVDVERRQAIARAHSATHLLHYALHQVLGEHALQSGSLVEPDRFRFDFSHFSALTAEEIARVEELVARKILEAHPVEVMHTELAHARQMGAIALFGEKYGERVRAVKMGDFSLELCGGTHLHNTAPVGLMRIIGESSIGAGLRRIEAVTGLETLHLAQEDARLLDEAAARLHASKAEVPALIVKVQDGVKVRDKVIASLRARGAAASADDLIAAAQAVNDFRVVAGRVPDAPADALRNLADQLVAKLGSGVVVLGTVQDSKALFVAEVSKDLVKRGLHAGNLVREVAKMAGGGGGGRPDFAQAGGKDPSKIEAALALVRDLVQAQAERRAS